MSTNKKKKAKKKRSRQFRSTKIPPISVCMIVKNEERRLGECLELAGDFADEIVVVDTGSDDQTRRIAAELGARLYDFTWTDDYSAARNESLRHAQGKWIIWLDADDRIYPDQHDKIRLLASSKPDRAYNFLLQNDGIDKSQCHQLRMFPNRPDIRFERPVHEQIATSVTIAKMAIENTDITLVHTGYETEEIVKEKKERYIGLMSKWLEKKPDDSAIRYQLALALHTLNRNEEACKEFKLLIDHFPEEEKGDPVYYYSVIVQGRTLFALGRVDEALTGLQVAEKIDPRPSFLKISIAEVFIHQGNYKKAIEYLSGASDLPDKQMSFFPVDFTVLRYGRLALLAKAKLEIGDYETAERLIKEAVELVPDKPEAYKFYAELHRKLGNYKEAITQYELASERDRGNFYHDFQVGEIHFSLGWLIKAKLHFKNALKKSPDHPAVLLKLAIIERGCGRYDRAITYFKNLMNKGYNDLHVNTEYAFCTLDQGEYEILAKELASIGESEIMSWMNHLLNLYFDKRERFENDLSSNYPDIAGKTNRDITTYLQELAVRSRSESNLHLAELILRARLFYAEEGIVESLKELAAVQIENNRHFQAIATLEQSLQFCLEQGQTIQILKKMGSCYLQIGVDQAHEMCNRKIMELESSQVRDPQK